MVLMRVLILFLLVFGHLSSAQTRLTGVEIHIEEMKNDFEVKARFEIEAPAETEELNLKAITFGGATIRQIQVENYEPITNQGDELTTVRIPLSGINPGTINLSYSVTTGEKGEIPIFFGDWQSASSDQQFFQAQLSVREQTNLLFPSDSEVDGSNGTKMITAFLPATTSLIRIEQGIDSGSQWIHWVDLLVIGLFIVIGAMIWFNRKRLIYG